MFTELFSLKGRIALVTGGSRGIGRMIAAGFLSQGASKVYITARKAAASQLAPAKKNDRVNRRGLRPMRRSRLHCALGGRIRPDSRPSPYRAAGFAAASVSFQ